MGLSAGAIPVKHIHLPHLLSTLFTFSSKILLPLSSTLLLTLTHHRIVIIITPKLYNNYPLLNIKQSHQSMFVGSVKWNQNANKSNSVIERPSYFPNPVISYTGWVLCWCGRVCVSAGLTVSPRRRCCCIIGKDANSYTTRRSKWNFRE